MDHQIFSYLRSRMVPAELQNKIRDYFEFLWSHDIENEPLRLDMLPDSLQVEVAIEVNRNLIQKVPLFEGLSPLATFELISNLSRKVGGSAAAAAAAAAAAVVVAAAAR